jgi:PDZ domain
MGYPGKQVVFLAGCLFWGLPAVTLCQDEATRALVDSLASEQFKERTKAQMDLARWALDQPDLSQDWLFREFEAAEDPEVRLRLREVMKGVVVAEHQKDGPGFVGISMMDVQVTVPGDNGPEARAGISVSRVNPDTPASRAGIQAGDVVVSVDELRWDNGSAMTGFQEAIMKHKPGDKVELGILRGAELMKVEVTLAARPMGLPEVGKGPAIQFQGIQGLQAIPGIRLNFLQLGEEELKAQEEKMKADEKKAQEDCLEVWLREQRARGGKP